MAQHESKASIYAAIVRNLAIAVSKFGAAGFNKIGAANEPLAGIHSLEATGLGVENDAT